MTYPLIYRQEVHVRAKSLVAPGIPPPRYVGRFLVQVEREAVEAEIKKSGGRIDEETVGAVVAARECGDLVMTLAKITPADVISPKAAVRLEQANPENLQSRPLVDRNGVTVRLLEEQR